MEKIDIENDELECIEMSTIDGHRLKEVILKINEKIYWINSQE